ncbi:MAG: glycosyltransferase [Planctomycetota bacterium]
MEPDASAPAGKIAAAAPDDRDDRDARDSLDAVDTLNAWRGRRVCVLLAKDRPGGLVGYVGDLVKTLREHGVRTRLLAAASDGADALRARLGGEDFIEPTLGPLPGVVRHEAAAADAALIHTAKFPPDTRFAWRLLGLRTPVVELLHGLPRRPAVRATRSALYAIRGSRSYRLFVLNNEMLRMVEREAPSLAPYSGVVLSGTRLPSMREAVPQNPTPVVVSVTRLDETSKDCGTFIRAAAELKRRGVAATSILVGDGDDRAALETLNSSLGQPVEFAGWHPDPLSIVAKADVFVLSTKGEAFGRATAEASALGLPVIASDVMGCRDVVRDGRTGLLVPPGDTAALADAVAALLSDTVKRAEFGRAGAAHVQRFSIERHAGTLLAAADGMGSRDGGRPRA